MGSYDEQEIWSTYEGFVNALNPKFNKPFAIPLKIADENTLKDYGRIVRDFEKEDVWIESWPQPGRRPLCLGTGINAGIKQGDFRLTWDGDLMRSNNVAAGPVGQGFVTGRLPADVSPSNRTHVLVRDVNYHPDGGQVFFPLERKSFVALLAAPCGDDIQPSDLTAFYFDGSAGLQIKPGVWHQSPYPLDDELTFIQKQNATYACIMVDFVKEFGQYLKVPLKI